MTIMNYVNLIEQGVQNLQPPAQLAVRRCINGENLDPNAVGNLQIRLSLFDKGGSRIHHRRHQGAVKMRFVIAAQHIGRIRHLFRPKTAELLVVPAGHHHINVVIPRNISTMSYSPQ